MTTKLTVFILSEIKFKDELLILDSKQCKNLEHCNQDKWRDTEII
jgi:hypothetical protein